MSIMIVTITRGKISDKVYKKIKRGIATGTSSSNIIKLLVLLFSHCCHRKHCHGYQGEQLTDQSVRERVPLGERDHLHLLYLV